MWKTSDNLTNKKTKEILKEKSFLFGVSTKGMSNFMLSKRYITTNSWNIWFTKISWTWEDIKMLKDKRLKFYYGIWSDIADLSFFIELPVQSHEVLDLSKKKNQQKTRDFIYFQFMYMTSMTRVLHQLLNIGNWNKDQLYHPVGSFYKD